jgi:hypothetical protein
LWYWLILFERKFNQIFTAYNSSLLFTNSKLNEQQEHSDGAPRAARPTIL